MQKLMKAFSPMMLRRPSTSSLLLARYDTTKTLPPHIEKVQPQSPHQLPVGAEIGFYTQVDTFFDRAAALLKERLVDEVPGNDPIEFKKRKVDGLLTIIKPCNSVYTVSFPLRFAFLLHFFWCYEFNFTYNKLKEH